MKYEWKKQEKEFYGAKKSPSLVTIPAQNYIMISGKGNPNDIDFSNRVSALYSLAYAIKMAYKASGLWATTRTKGRQAFIAIVRALKASQALGRAALTGRGGTPARLC